ncbi:hypothetical protein [Desulfosporosinus meridiei]|uniref:Uncharacterized protein n=1 Tax=Desulfosporosinus meridiei (strain ATCC BAA-275 / DSM 13257 / KCTC 12902 / NCIMB 13706 / S10) TaxID=768704 RepID=J7J0Y3_DESMD|nr:hypothetical protein [Desulfosporosinus meridiei]AFQ46024.1 hypothetical protein Desmer_4196 [Desulfosporosinus meridiei DSM 13257]
MSLEESIRFDNLNTIKTIFMIATIFLLAAVVQTVVQKLKPTFSLSYSINSKPSYLKAKLIAKLVTSATIYLSGLYFYFLTDLSVRSKYSMWALAFSYIIYHPYRWGFAKIFEIRDKNKTNTL